jgi:hypothetical protein
MDAKGDTTRPVARLGSDTKAHIGRKLRTLYDEIVNQGTPSRFVRVLERLDDADRGDGGGRVVQVIGPRGGERVEPAQDRDVGGNEKSDLKDREDAKREGGNNG